MESRVQESHRLEKNYSVSAWYREPASFPSRLKMLMALHSSFMLGNSGLDAWASNE